MFRNYAIQQASVPDKGERVGFLGTRSPCKKAVLLMRVEVEETLIMDIWLALHNNNNGQ
jgi:hypothetical protein